MRLDLERCQGQYTGVLRVLLFVLAVMAFYELNRQIFQAIY